MNRTPQQQTLELLKLLDYISTEGNKLVEVGTGTRAAKTALQQELRTHAHLMRKTLDTIDRNARRN